MLIFAGRMGKNPLRHLIAVGLCAVSSLMAQIPAKETFSQERTRFALGEEQGFTLRKEHDSLYWLNDWRLPYPVYQFQTGDVDGDGRADAMVGVIKSTRFYSEVGRRLFIFKLVNKKARPLWLGSKLGGILEDFRYMTPAEGDSLGRIRALESTTDSFYVVSDYKWDSFGMKFDHYIIKGVDKQTAIKTFSQ